MLGFMFSQSVVNLLGTEFPNSPNREHCFTYYVTREPARIFVFGLRNFRAKGILPAGFSSTPEFK